MVMKAPNELDALLLYWWKIVDRPTISKEELQNFIAFDLYTFSLDETKKMLQQGIDEGYLFYDPTTEILTLHPTLQTEFDQWQAGGREKVKKMIALLQTPWCGPITFEDTQKYKIYLADLIDANTQSQASKILASAVTIVDGDFAQLLSGTIHDYSFIINPKTHQIKHNCPDFLHYRVKNKKFCIHLARIIMKFYSNQPEETYTLIQNIVKHKEEWEFQAS
ncbi:MAG: hypothetical protein E4G98_04590 [Promethearchaeota archaeon]|nr:MAG: hypothetical protein E4G98_04590 [Candidatus Lokiarchaeota archaeon]